MYTSTILSTLAIATLAVARTDLAGCTSSVAGPRLVWYVPGTGELCEILDCGGGRAPAKTTVPGCAAYVGTATYEPSYLPGYGPEGALSTEVPVVSSSAVAAYSSGYAEASETPSGYPEASETPSASSPSTLATITSAVYLTNLPTISVGTGTGSSSMAHHTGNNVTGTATLSTGPSIPESTGAAAALKVVKQGVLGVAAGVLGLALL